MDRTSCRASVSWQHATTTINLGIRSKLKGEPPGNTHVDPGFFSAWKLAGSTTDYRIFSEVT